MDGVKWHLLEHAQAANPLYYAGRLSTLGGLDQDGVKELRKKVQKAFCSKFSEYIALCLGLNFV